MPAREDRSAVEGIVVGVKKRGSCKTIGVACNGVVEAGSGRWVHFQRKCSMWFDGDSVQECREVEAHDCRYDDEVSRK